jgi:alginate O-acetyltransferase complex protein AlgI
MHFNSFLYVFKFLPLVLVLYYLNNKLFNKNIILVVASYTFYSWGNSYFALLLLSSSLVDYFIGKKMHACNFNLETSNGEINERCLNRKKRILLACSIAFNLALLSFFKYWDFIIEILYAYLVFDGQRLLDLRDYKHYIAVPPGISFYTFQTLSYTIDIYRRQFSPKGNFFDYLTYVAFFPQLIAGPIERAKDLLPQLATIRKRVSSKVGESAFFLISWGLFKKVIIADNLGFIISRCQEYLLSAGDLNTNGIGFILVLAFAFQIYCDFSAYSDIARGTARLFGIRLRRNFLTPYFAINPSDFWRRWHISLSSWIRDYIYFPLGGNRFGRLRSIANVIFTMFLIGLWHGAGIFFIAWGVYNGLLIVFYRIVPIDKYLIRFLGAICGKFVAGLIMFSFVLFGWLLFWAKDEAMALTLYKSFVSVSYFITDQGNLPVMFFEFGYVVLLFIVPIITAEVIGYKYKREFVDMYKFFGLKVKVSLYLLMFYGAMFLGSTGTPDFIYFQF